MSDAPRPWLNVGETLGEAFEITALVPVEGGLELYLARELDLGRCVLIGVSPAHMSAHRVETAVATLGRAAQLRHPNLATLYQVGFERGRVFAVYEGGTGGVNFRLAPGNEAAAICLRLGEALSRAHASGVHHLAVQPGCVIRDFCNDFKLVGLGLLEGPDGVSKDIAALGRLAQRIAGVSDRDHPDAKGHGWIGRENHGLARWGQRCEEGHYDTMDVAVQVLRSSTLPSRRAKRIWWSMLVLVVMAFAMATGVVFPEDSVQKKPLSAAAVDSLGGVPPRPIAYWDFERVIDEGQLTDRIGDHDGEFFAFDAGMMPIAPGVAGDSMRFGDSGHVEVGSLSNFGVPFSVAAWVYSESNLESRRLFAPAIVDRWSDLDEQPSVRLGQRAGTFFAKVSRDGTTVETLHVPDSYPLQPRQWTHIGMVFDGKSLRLYRDGDLTGLVFATHRFSPTDLSSSETLGIGLSPKNPDEPPWPRRIDEVAIWFNALTPIQIAYLYARGLAGEPLQGLW